MPIIQHKVCTKCKLEKGLDQYDTHKMGKLGLNPVCKPCRGERQRRNRKDQGYGSLIKYRYGIGWEDYVDKLNQQSNKCAVCSIELDQKGLHKTKSVIDHNHDTKQVRGILCWSCNVALGLLKEDTEIMNRLIEYTNAHHTS